MVAPFGWDGVIRRRRMARGAARWLAVLLGAAGALAPAAAVAGKLDDVERAAREPAPARQHGAQTQPAEADENERDDSWLYLAGELAVMTFLYGGASSVERVLGEGDESTPRREPGECLIPFLRANIGFQDVAGDVRALDTLVEVGFASVGFQVRRTAYEEVEPDDRLNVTQYHGLYRMSFGGATEVDMGFGALRVAGDAVSTGFSFTLPARYRFSRAFAVEYRPTWSTVNQNRIAEHDVAFLLGWPYAAVRVGYRWFRAEDEALNGPHAGLALHW